jgi:hypothetical protein
MSRGGNRPGAGRLAGSQNADTAAMRAALSGLPKGHVALGSSHGHQVCDQIGGCFLPRAVALDHRQNRARNRVAVKGGLLRSACG